DRYIFIMHALHYRRISTKKFGIGLLLASWTAGFISSLTFYLRSYVRPPHESDIYCLYPANFIIFLSSVFCLIVVATSVLYIRIGILVCTMKGNATERVFSRCASERSFSENMADFKKN